MADAQYVIYIQRYGDELGPLPVHEHDLKKIKYNYLESLSLMRTFLHRSGGLPAVVGKDGTREYWENGCRHREGDLPAVIRADGTREWLVNDMRHRDGDLPAVVRADGTLEWWANDELHRDGGRPARIRVDGGWDWLVDGELLLSNCVTDFDDGSLRLVFVTTVLR